MLRIVPWLALGLLGLAGCSAAPRCDRIFVGAVAHTPAGAQRLDIAVAEGRIVALIAPAQSGSWRRAAAQVVDLAGMHVYAGFAEGHGHLLGYGTALEQVDLHDAASFAEVVKRVAAAATKVPAGTWVMGRGWDQNRWPITEFPRHEALSAAVPDHPVLLRRIDGHAVLTNRRGLSVARIDAATPDPAGGRILRGPDGAPSGVLVDTATDLLERGVPPATTADIERRILLASRHLAAFGLTEIHDAGTGQAELAVLRRLQQEARLPIRVYAMLDGGDDALLDAEFAAGPRVTRDGMLAVRAVKLYADGALGSRGAWLSAPYTDEPGTRGLEVTSLERLTGVIRRAAGAGFQPAIHAIGDAAVTRALDLYERGLGERARTLRPRIEHAQIVRPDDVARFARIGVIAAVQPTHCTSDMPWAPTRLGAERTAWAYRWRSLLAAGARLCLGSDVPVESPDLRLGVWAAVTRRTPEGTPVDGWNPGERLSMGEAVAGYTASNCYAAFEEDWRGRLESGFAADLTVLDRELDDAATASILQVGIMRTVVAGRDIYVVGSRP